MSSPTRSMSDIAWRLKTLAAARLKQPVGMIYEK
jgi:hypothetical protein